MKKDPLIAEFEKQFRNPRVSTEDLVKSLLGLEEIEMYLAEQAIALLSEIPRGAEIIQLYQARRIDPWQAFTETLPAGSVNEVAKALKIIARKLGPIKALSATKIIEEKRGEAFLIAVCTTG